MKLSVLPILNIIGCLALASLVVNQWRKEHRIKQEKVTLTHQLADAHTLITTQEARTRALERDIATLKEAIEATQNAAESTTRELSKTSELATDLQSKLEAARTQITAWETAIRLRDERIHTLTNDLTATRKRLDEAVAKLKEAAQSGN